MSGSASPSLTPRAPQILRLLAALVVIASIGFWWAKGAHRGWSQHQVPIVEAEELTGLEYVRYEDRYRPGLEWPIGGAAVAVLLFGASFLFRSHPKPHA